MISEAKSKLNMADFLVQKDKDYLPGAMKHIVQSALIVIKALTKMDDKSAGSPQLVKTALGRMKQPTVDEFSKEFVKIWELSGKTNLNSSEVSKALNKVRIFANWVEEELIKDEDEKNNSGEASS